MSDARTSCSGSSTGLRTHLPQLPEPDAPSSTVPFGAVRSGGMTARTTT
jgi:hypothetical protein